MIQELLCTLNMKKEEVKAIDFVDAQSWMAPILCHLKTKELSSNVTKAKKIRRLVAQYTMVEKKTIQDGNCLPHADLLSYPGLKKGIIFECMHKNKG